MEEMNREQLRTKMLDGLLQPITWNWSSSIRARQNLVIRRRTEVATILPFLNDEELARAKKWLKDEKHDGLWD